MLAEAVAEAATAEAAAEAARAGVERRPPRPIGRPWQLALMRRETQRETDAAVSRGVDAVAKRGPGRQSDPLSACKKKEMRLAQPQLGARLDRAVR